MEYECAVGRQKDAFVFAHQEEKVQVAYNCDEYGGGFRYHREGVQRTLLFMLRGVDLLCTDLDLRKGNNGGAQIWPSLF